MSCSKIFRHNTFIAEKHLILSPMDTEETKGALKAYLENSIAG